MIIEFDYMMLLWLSVVILILTVAARLAFGSTERDDECHRGGKKHNYQPRYCEQENQNLNKLKAHSHDVCQWCGHLKEREDHHE